MANKTITLTSEQRKVLLAILKIVEDQDNIQEDLIDVGYIHQSREWNNRHKDDEDVADATEYVVEQVKVLKRLIR